MAQGSSTKRAQCNLMKAVWDHILNCHIDAVVGLKAFELPLKIASLLPQRVGKMTH
jgi:hypothetical protein